MTWQPRVSPARTSTRTCHEPLIPMNDTVVSSVMFLREVNVLRDSVEFCTEHRGIGAHVSICFAHDVRLKHCDSRMLHTICTLQQNLQGWAAFRKLDLRSVPVCVPVNIVHALAHVEQRGQAAASTRTCHLHKTQRILTLNVISFCGYRSTACTCETPYSCECPLLDSFRRRATGRGPTVASPTTLGMTLSP